MSYTTEQCKVFLVHYFSEQTPAIDTLEKEWKRTKKYKNEQGLWLRDFTHPVVGSVTLVENTHGLSVQPELTKQSSNTYKNNYIDWLVFNKKAQKEALNIVQYYAEELDVDKDSAKFEQYAYAIPNQIGFYFYDAYLDNSFAEKNLNFKIGKNDTQEFCVTIAPLFDPHFDQHINWLIGSYLPNYLGEMSEALYDITDSDITIEQFVRDMSERGFVYLQDECFFGEIFSNFHFHPISAKNEKNKQLVKEESFQIKEKIMQGDIAWLEEKIQSGFDSNTIFANGECALIHALKHNQPDIFDLFLRHTNLSLTWNEDSIIEHICHSYYHHKNNLDTFFEHYLYPVLSASHMPWQDDNLVVDDEFYYSGKVYKNPSWTTIIYLDNFRAYPELVQKTFALFDEKIGSTKTDELIDLFMQSDAHLVAYPELANRFLDFCSRRCANGDYQFIGKMIKFEHYPLALKVIKHCKVKIQNITIDGENFNDFFNNKIKHWREDIQSELNRGFIMVYEYADGTCKTRPQEFQEHIDLAQRFIKQVQNGDTDYQPGKYKTKF